MTEWFISGNPTKFDLINAFKNLGTIDWKQSTNVAVGDIVYIYVSAGHSSVKYKCRVNKVDLKTREIDDSAYDITGEFDGTYGRYMELEKLAELQGDVYGREMMEPHGFGTPQSPVRVQPETKEYLDIVQKLQHSEEMDPDKHDGSYELVRETVRAYRNMSDLAELDYKDLNLLYHMSIGTWRHSIDQKKKSVQSSHLPQAEKDRLITLLDTVWNRAENGEYDNREGEVSVGMFGTGFYSFRTDDQSPRNFIRACADILDLNDEEMIYYALDPVLKEGIPGMKAASASVILHCLKPTVFPIFNTNFGRDTIYNYFQLNLDKPTNLTTYIPNCRVVKDFRDLNFSVKNYRIFDIAAGWVGKTGKRYDPIDFEAIVSYLKDYSGQKYSTPDKAPDKREYMEQFKDAGSHARDEFTRYCNDVVSTFPNMEALSCSSWINQGMKTPSYFWIELKDRNWGQYPHSVSIAIVNEDPSGEEWTISARVEVRDNICKEEDYRRHNVIADLEEPENDECYYVYVDRNGKYNFAESGRQEVIELRDSGQVVKIQLIKRISKPYSSDRTTEIIVDTQKAVELLLPYYNYIFERAGITGESSEYWPSKEEYDPGLSTEKWIEILKNPEITYESNLRMFAMMLDYGRPAACSELAEHYGETKNFFNKGSSSMAKRVADATGCPTPPDRMNDNARWWPVLYVGRNADKDEKGSYIWKFRDELKAALEQIELPEIKVIPMKTGKEIGLNTILYGPPGTGKTYNTMIYAVAIIEEKAVELIVDETMEDYAEVKARYESYKDAGLIAFTTFHQSYGYEEFIEGIKPVLEDPQYDESRGGDIQYQISPGIFKEFCDRAYTPIVAEEKEDIGLNRNPVVWKVSLEGAGDNETRRECLENGHIRLGWDEYGPDLDENTDYQYGGKGILDAFINQMRIGDVVLSCYSKSETDAIGIITGEYEWHEEYDYYRRLRTVKWLVKDIRENILRINNGSGLTLSSVYKMKVSISDVMDIVKKYKNPNNAERPKKYVFVIDEINRGNISKIFGELITLIEPTKRIGQDEELRVRLPYSPTEFGVPSNVYLLGTMNTADRSIPVMDTALRRRFSFVEMMPDTNVLRSINADTVSSEGKTLDVAQMLDVINKRIEYLYDREHTIGHAFFTPLSKDPSIECLGSIFEKTIIPLLQEYFYEDYGKIQLVLGDDGKTGEDKQYQFIKDTEVKSSDIFNTPPDMDLPDKKYEIQKDAFYKIDSYKMMAKGL